ncbi:MAG TPA: YugN family protein [Ureibacillus sp.]|nr:YugN family protein [Ureibacillus sp.]
MINLQTELDGKHAKFGFLHEKLKKDGFCLGSYWEYDRGFFDSVLAKREGETIYLRLPFVVTQGELDSYHANIKFQTPYVVKHVVHVGLEHDGSALLDATGFSQFQTPIDKDAEIINKSKWVHKGEEVVGKVVNYLN